MLTPSPERIVKLRWRASGRVHQLLIAVKDSVSPPLRISLRRS